MPAASAPVDPRPCRYCSDGTVSTVKKAGLRGYLVRKCGGCGIEPGLPWPAAVERKQQKLARGAHRRLGGDVVAPGVPSPRRRNGWTPDLGVPRGDRD